MKYNCRSVGVKTTRSTYFSVYGPYLYFHLLVTFSLFVSFFIISIFLLLSFSLSLCSVTRLGDLLKSFLGNFYRHLAIFFWSQCLFVCFSLYLFRSPFDSSSVSCIWHHNLYKSQFLSRKVKAKIKVLFFSSSGSSSTSFWSAFTGIRPSASTRHQYHKTNFVITKLP